MSHNEATPSERRPTSALHPPAAGASAIETDGTCVVCGAVAPDATRAGWHVFDDGTGEEHALCAGCLKAAPAGGRAA